jgi:hypothetical protein
MSQENDDEIAPVAPANPDDLTVNQLVWLLADLCAVGNEDRQAEAQATLARYGLDYGGARRLLRQKRKRHR